MKKFLVVFAVLSLTAAAQAEQMCADIPAGLKFDSMDANFDGSVTVTNPKVVVGGRPVALAAYHDRYAFHSSAGVCHLIGKRFVTDKSQPLSPLNQLSVILTATGELHSLPSGHQGIVSQVLCR